MKCLSFLPVLRTLLLCIGIATPVLGKNKNVKLAEGSWLGVLELTHQVRLPFDVQVKKNNASYEVHVLNGKEDIPLIWSGVQKDSIKLDFPAFGTYLILHTNTKSSMSGYWVNPNKTGNYRIPCTLKTHKGKRFDHPGLYQSTADPINIQGRWETTFEPGTKDAYKAVGIFDQNYNELSGTFLTETGDYRFLEGNVVRDSLFLSCFDGSHAFLFKGKVIDSKEISGDFFSGKHWSCKWSAVKNDSFELTDPDSLTYLKRSEPFTVQFNDPEGKPFTFPTSQTSNKVVILQIMGTWCPNCMDESRFFKEMYAKYHDKGLEIIALCYESGTDVSLQKERIETLSKRLNAGYSFILAGTASKGLASNHFSMLNQVMSFPTAIFIGRDGNVKRIHTGFNGPGTGTYYEDYIKETESFIQELLK
jgi:thiol-disulfide isomerase/thioredoxin